ncbi:MAG: SusC/RagA family TonB-linked outer membrane protein, partial [Saprospiraceae bacterium]|nr:SusC/RagA family TonB-linked outer membrane protein [Saprospiraceae bacterium]
MKFLHTFTKGGMLAVLLLLLGNFALAQRTVVGKVTDAENGEPLIGATVSVVGTTRGAVTDIDGKYSVDVPDGSTQLRFAYTGYAEEVVTLSSSNVVEIAMKPGSVLDEVVVVGYGTVKSKEVTSAVASLKPKDFNKGNISDPAQLLQGKIAGVTISRPGSNPNGEFTIRLRGLSSLSSGVSPLIVVDGIPGVNLSLIDPNDIESMDVLKDGSAAAIYGTRASAGVVLITTKKGSAGRTTASYNGFVAFDQVSRRYNTLDAARFVELGGNDLSPEDGAGDTNTDWFDEITQTGKSNVHNLSLAGGVANGSYRISFNYRNIEGILRETGFKQYNSSLSFNQKVLNNRLNISGGLLLTSRQQDFGFLDAFRYAIVANPTAKITDPGNPEYDRYGGYVEKDLFDYFNPVAIVEQNNFEAKGNRLMGNFRTEYEIIPNLKAALTLAQERFNYDYGEFYSKQSKWRGIGGNGVGIQGTNFYVSNLLEATGEYKINFNTTSNLTILGGYSWQQFDYNGLNIQANNIISNEFTNANLGAFLSNGRGLSTVSSYKGRNRLIAFFGRASINIDDTYFGSVGLRREGSSRFGPDNRWGVFPFVSAGVNLEKLMNLNNVEQLKLRAGYGVTGNQPNQNSLYREVYTQGPLFYYNGNYVPS